MALNEADPEGNLAPLRIAMVIPPWYELPPSGYGGIEMICAALVDGLCARGHEVTVFGAGTGTDTKASFVSTCPQIQHERLGEGLPDALHAARVNQLLAGGEFDIVHDHSLCGPLAAGQRTAPTVVTAHSRADGELGDFYAALGDQVDLVAISKSQRHSRAELNWAATIHNAIDPAQFSPTHRPDGPVLWLARFSPTKGPDLAILACRAAGLPLVLAGKCTEPDEKRYFGEVVRPLLGSDVELVVNGDRNTTNRLLREARCLIMPIRWPEPFGMVMIEAMASGTPVVALRRGAVPEVVRHGSAGLICDDPSELPRALLGARELDPDDCVAHVRNRFSASRMVRRYEQVYRTAIANAQQVRWPVRRSVGGTRVRPAPSVVGRTAPQALLNRGPGRAVAAGPA